MSKTNRYIDENDIDMSNDMLDDEYQYEQWKKQSEAIYNNLDTLYHISNILD